MTKVSDVSDFPDAERCALYFKAMADPIRLRIVRALQTGPLSVSDVAQLLELDLGNVSHHLRVLFHANLTTTQRNGKFIYYCLNEEFFCERASAKSFDFGCCRIDLNS